ncbi:hypothetical protein [Faecalispora anaeroviscerum]|uniref:hypothetical protein n=1 Tax=Faecalispora anaeroviscerum TaxID=2991836 RepID=UPI0024B9A921|nr:hypothetical protein [Faecalispora anaeroviscerum]
MEVKKGVATLTSVVLIYIKRIIDIPIDELALINDHINDGNDICKKAAQHSQGMDILIF